MDSDGGGPGVFGDLHWGYNTSAAAGGIYAGFTQSTWLSQHWK